MAGIGFSLKKLVAKDDLLGVFRAFGSSAFASSGPWLFTILALGAITFLHHDIFANDQLINFRVIIVYNFSFSLVLSAPVFMVITRYLADRIHMKNVTETPSVMLGSLVLLYLVQLPFAAWYYLYYVNLELPMRIAAMVNLFLITAVWLLGIFLTALKDYNAVSRSFGIGMLIAVIMADFLSDEYKDVGMMIGFSLGVAFTVFTLAAKIFAEYNYRFHNPFAAKEWFKKYWELAAGGVFYNAAIWIDKWIMWHAPEAVTLPSKMIFYPDYDTAMFMAYVTIVPAMAAFIFSVETHFFERYQRFYDNILAHAPYRKIQLDYREIVDSIMVNSRNFIIVQGAIAILAILLAPKLFEWLNVNYMQIGIFRLGVLGSFFHVLMLFQMIILSYFDNRRVVMWLQLIFLLTNIVFTLWSLDMGFPYYGYGYFLSSMVTFLLTSIVLFRHLKYLPYHAFVTNNNSVKAV
jgi:uncharacterized membrane protein